MTEPFMKPGHWYDWDQAGHALVASMGLYHYEGSTFGPAKWVWWTNNPVGNAVHEFLDKLADAGLLEKNEDGQFRIRESYDPTKFAEECPHQ